MVEQASATKARTQLFIEKVEQRYSLGMVTATLLLFADPADRRRRVPAHAAARDDLHDRRLALRGRAGHDAPAAGRDGQRGPARRPGQVRRRDGAARRHDPVAFDKTGTLTEGTPRLTGITVLPGAGLGEQDVLALAAAAEAPSEHPLGRAVTAAARDAGLALARAEEFTAVPGRGVSALVSGRRVEIGSPAHLLGDQAHGRGRRARRGAGRRRADRRRGAGGRDRGRAAGHRGPHPPGRRARRRPDHRGDRRRPGPAHRRQPARRRPPGRPGRHRRRPRGAAAAGQGRRRQRPPGPGGAGSCSSATASTTPPRSPPPPPGWRWAAPGPTSPWTPPTP